MKRSIRAFAFILLAAMALSLAACGLPQKPQQEITYYEGFDVNTQPPADQPRVDPVTVTPVPVVIVTPEPAPVTPVPTPEPTPEPYYLKLMEKIAARDSRIVLPPEAAFFEESEICTKYVQGIYGQGILLMTASENGENIGLLNEGTRLTLYAVQGDRGLVLTEDGRYGWAVIRRMVDKFDPDLSYQRKREYLIDHPDDWTNPSWYAFIIDHADDLPWEVVAAARDAKR